MYVEILFCAKHYIQDTENTQSLPWGAIAYGRERKCGIQDSNHVCAFLC